MVSSEEFYSSSGITTLHSYKGNKCGIKNEKEKSLFPSTKWGSNIYTKADICTTKCPVNSL